MTRLSLKLWHVLMLIVAALVAWMFYQYQSQRPSFRYRLTVELDVGEKSLTASSIIQASYLLGNTDGNGLRFHSSARGIAPIFDLGPDGTLIAALSYDASDLSRRQTIKNGTYPRMPTAATHIPLRAFRVPPEQIRGASGVAVLDPEYYPAFVWIPAQASWQTAQQMFYDEIPARTGKAIRVTKITVEPAYWQTVVRRVPNAPQWLTNMRPATKGLVISSAHSFNFAMNPVEKE